MPRSKDGHITKLKGIRSSGISWGIFLLLLLMGLAQLVEGVSWLDWLSGLPL